MIFLPHYMWAENNKPFATERYQLLIMGLSFSIANLEPKRQANPPFVFDPSVACSRL